MQKYIIFNPVVGQHTSVDTVTEAKQTQIKLIREYIETVVVGMFTCNLETTNEDGSKTWTAFDLELEKEIPTLVEEAVRKSIVEYFGVGTMITEELIRKVLLEEGLIQEDQVYDIESGQSN
jgi:UPF0288 family protein (methanogenesis marker protein 3)